MFRRFQRIWKWWTHTPSRNWRSHVNRECVEWCQFEFHRLSACLERIWWKSAHYNFLVVLVVVRVVYFVKVFNKCESSCFSFICISSSKMTILNVCLWFSELWTHSSCFLMRKENNWIFVLFLFCFPHWAFFIFH